MGDILVNEYGFVYGIKSLDLIKVGVAKDIEKRLKAMRLDNPHGCELVFYRRTYAPYTFERKMHQLLADKAVGREWFLVTEAELRIAASKAKYSSLRAQRANERADLGPRILARELTHHATDINEFNALE